MTYSQERPNTTQCERCGEKLQYRRGAKPKYCGGCSQVIRRRMVR